MKKFFNIRYIFIAFISVIATILCVTNLFCFYFENNFLCFYILLSFFIFLCVAPLILFLIFSFLDDRNKLKTKSKLSKVFLVSAIFIVLTGILSAINLRGYSSCKTYRNVVAVVTISDNVKFNDNYVSAKTRNIQIIEDGCKTDLPYNGLINIFGNTSNKELFKNGNRIYFVGDVESYKFSFKNLDNFYNNRVYKINVNLKDTIIEKGSGTVAENFRQSVKNLLVKNLNSENAGIAYSILFGDKSLIDKAVKNAFSFSGLAHLLAVSGLHVGVLVSILYAFANLVKMNKKLSFLFIILILIIYSSLCGFTSSVVRASVMCVVFMLADLLNRKYDALNSLSIAGIIILLFSPLAIFNVGFQLSFLCVFTIITCAKYVSSALTFIKIPKILADILSISFIVGLTTMPIIANAFNQISILSWLSNLIVLPVFSACFIILFLFVIICLIMPFLSSILVVPNLGLQFLKIVANFISEIPFSVVRILNVSFFAIIFAIVLCYLTKFLILKTKIKIPILALTFVCFLFSMCSGFSFSNFVKNTISINYVNEVDNQIIITDEFNKNTLVLSSDYNYYSVVNFLNNKKIRDIDNLICYNLTTLKFEVVKNLVKYFNIKNVVVPNKYKYGIENCNVLDDVSLLNLKFTIKNFNKRNTNKTFGVIIENESDAFVFTTKDVTGAEINIILGETYKNINYINFVRNSKIENFIENKTVYDFTNTVTFEVYNNIVDCEDFVSIKI